MESERQEVRGKRYLQGTIDNQDHTPMRSQQNSFKESEWVANFVELGVDETVRVSFANCKFIYSTPSL